MVSFWQKEGEWKLILETDSQVFLTLWKEDVNLRSEIAPIISEILALVLIVF
jgi:hypothetical protein